MSKYNIGDIVKLRDDLKGFDWKWEQLQNKPLLIKDVCKRNRDCTYLVDEEWLLWASDKMIEGLWDECKEKQVTMKYKIGDRFRYKDEYNTYRIISCDEEVGRYITVEEKQVGSRAFDVCEEKNMFLEECKEKQDKLKLIDVLNMIARDELKEGTSRHGFRRN